MEVCRCVEFHKEVLTDGGTLSRVTRMNDLSHQYKTLLQPILIEFLCNTHVLTYMYMVTQPLTSFRNMIETVNFFITRYHFTRQFIRSGSSNIFQRLVRVARYNPFETSRYSRYRNFERILSQLCPDILQKLSPKFTKV